MAIDPVIFDPVLTTAPPRIDPAQAVEVGAARFGIAADAARDLGSERDRTFMLLHEGRPAAVLKVSNPAEDPATLDMEAAVVDHARRVDPELPLTRPLRTAEGDDRVAFEDSWVRCYEVLPGLGRHDPMLVTDRALVAWGDTAARLGRATRGFIHPNALRTMPWDVQHAARCRPLLHHISDPEARRLVELTLDHFEAAVLPRWPSLRAQVVHGDLTIDNVLVDADGFITGIIDFGDMSHTALLVDLASVLDSIGTGREGDELVRAARLVLDGYQRVVPLEPLELELLGPTWAMRTAVGIAIGSWRAANGWEDADFALRYHAAAAAMLEHLQSGGWDDLAIALGADRWARTTQGRDDLARRRAAAFGPAIEPLTYDEPVEVASASGTWITDLAGRTFLDMYNNVPCVGHAHPRVTEAIARQSRVLNTNLRYLHAGAVELAERLSATCPDGLDTVIFVNSGSEANDLAWRLARVVTGNRGVLCTWSAYHGITDATAAFSPEVLAPDALPDHVVRFRPPDTYRGLHGDTTEIDRAFGDLDERGHGLCLTILDGVLQSDGVHDLPAAYVRDLFARTHAAGGLWVADEVQGGYGRTGTAMWSFERFGIVPDVVTLGKPMGNGHPVAAVITRREIAQRLADSTVFFSTFGGNQVAVAAAHAVLDVLRDERVLERTTVAGESLREATRAAMRDAAVVGDVRGVGLANAIEIVTDRETKGPDAAMAARVKDELRRLGVLVGTTGEHGNVLKVRPPLAFTAGEVPVFVAALSRAVQAAAG